MKRYGTALLLAYSLSMTMIAAWLGARALIYRQMINVQLGVGASTTLHEIMIDFGAPRWLIGPWNETAMLIAGLNPVNMAAACLLILVTCIGFASRRPKPSEPALIPRKD